MKIRKRFCAAGSNCHRMAEESSQANALQGRSGSENDIEHHVGGMEQRNG